MSGNAVTFAFGWMGSPTAPAFTVSASVQSAAYGARPRLPTGTPSHACVIVGLPAAAAMTMSCGLHPASSARPSVSIASPSRTALARCAPPSGTSSVCLIREMTSGPNATCGFSTEAEAATDPSLSDTSAAASEVVPRSMASPKSLAVLPARASTSSRPWMATVSVSASASAAASSARAEGEAVRARSTRPADVPRASSTDEADAWPARSGARTVPTWTTGLASAGAGRSPPNDFPASDRATLGISTTAGAERRSWHERRQPSTSSSAVNRARSAAVGVGAPWTTRTRHRPQVPREPHGCSTRMPAAAAARYNSTAASASYGPNRRAGNGWGTVAQPLAAYS